MNDFYRRARFLISVPNLKAAPLDQGMEVAFAGRSNAGKSSAINTLTGQKALARTSKTPGRTQHMVFFQLDEERRLVDLPGYGYAKVSEAIKDQWQVELAHYLTNRQCLQGLMLMVDIRRLLTEYDERMLDWAQDADLPAHILLTKSDKLKRGPAKNALMQLQRTLDQNYPGCTAQLFSSLKRTGIDEAHAMLDRWYQLSVD